MVTVLTKKYVYIYIYIYSIYIYISHIWPVHNASHNAGMMLTDPEKRPNVTLNSPLLGRPEKTAPGPPPHSHKPLLALLKGRKGRLLPHLPQHQRTTTLFVEIAACFSLHVVWRDYPYAGPSKGQIGPFKGSEGGMDSE